MSLGKFSVAPIETESELIQNITKPTPEVVKAISRINGKIMILGISGKMGPSLGELLVRAGANGVIGVSRFSNLIIRENLEAIGIRTVQCDLLDENELRRLPEVEHIYLMAGNKFGSSQKKPSTWAINTMLPSKVMQRFPRSRIVYLSSGNVYQFTKFDSGGADESGLVNPVGEYAQSRLGGERLVEFHSNQTGTPVVIIRLFYATELRYGVVLDIAQRVLKREVINLEMGYVNQIWQGDVLSYLARSFLLCRNPSVVLNMAGPETLSVRKIAKSIGDLIGIEPIFKGIESEDALLGNSQELFKWFGFPKVTSSEIVEWVAWWTLNSRQILDKPTKYESRLGEF